MYVYLKGGGLKDIAETQAESQVVLNSTKSRNNRSLDIFLAVVEALCAVYKLLGTALEGTTLTSN
jgi:hypothetical protein